MDHTSSHKQTLATENVHYDIVSVGIHIPCDLHILTSEYLLMHLINWNLFGSAVLLFFFHSGPNITLFELTGMSLLYKADCHKEMVNVQSTVLDRVNGCFPFYCGKEEPRWIPFPKMENK